MITRRRAIIAAVVLGLAALVVVTPRTEDPDTTQAFRRFLAGLGYDVTEGAGLPPPDGTLVLPADLRTPDEAEPILSWVEDGGHLVVTDAESVFAPLLGATAAETVGFTGVEELEPGCVAAAVVGIDRIVARSTDRVLVAEDPEILGCFAVGSGHLLLTRALGDGRVTLLGGPSAFTNGLLRQADNAVLAAGVAGPGSAVVFGPPSITPPAAIGLWDALPDGGRAAALAVVGAAVAFALVRARRLGRPAVEEPIAPIPGSELVRAAARMYRQARATAYAGALMRRATTARVARRMGAAGAHDLSGALARSGGVSPERVREILEGGDPRNDDELMELGAELEGLTARAEMGSR